MNKTLCITGMHRSGTSLTASWLRSCGVSIDNGNRLGPSVGNMKGHFEDVDFVNLQSEALLRISPASKGWIVHENRNYSFSRTELQKARELIQQRNDNFSVWGWKDPRTVLFLNEWAKLIPDLKFLLIWRRASSVIGSLQSRYLRSKKKMDKISLVQAYQNWIIYNSILLDFYERNSSTSVLVNFEDLLINEQIIFSTIQLSLDLNLKFNSICNLYKKKLLSSYKSSLKDKILRKYFEIDNLEINLARNSLTEYNFS